MMVRLIHDGWMLWIRNKIIAVAIIVEKCSKWPYAYSATYFLSEQMPVIKRTDILLKWASELSLSL